MKVGDKVMVDDGRMCAECAVASVGRKYATIFWRGGSVQFDMSTGMMMGKVYGHGVRFYTFEQWAKRQRVADAQRLLEEVRRQSTYVSRLPDFVIREDEPMPPLDEFTQLMKRAVALLDACKEAKQ